MPDRFYNRFKLLQSRDQTAETEQLKKAFEATNEHRDYSIFVRSMDAALEAKAKSVFSNFKVEEGDGEEAFGFFLAPLILTLLAFVVDNRGIVI